MPGREVMVALWAMALALAVVAAGCKNPCEKAIDHVAACMREVCDDNPESPTCRRFAERQTAAPECDSQAEAQAAELLSQSCGQLTEAFDGYVSAAQSIEASLNVRHMASGAQYYYEREHVTPMGQLLPLQFPESAPRAPAEVPCGEAVAPDSSHWSHPSWQALGFELRDPHRFSYQFDSRGAGPDATFTAWAFGDLDCDGRLSTFRREGRVVGGEVETSDLQTIDERE